LRASERVLCRCIYQKRLENIERDPHILKETCICQNARHLCLTLRASEGILVGYI
jgi:hypothetical protein